MILVVDGIQAVVWPVSGRLPDGRIAWRGRHESIRPGSASLWPCKPFALVNGVEVHPVPGARRRFPRDDGCGRRDESRVARPGTFHRHSSLPSPSIRLSRPSVEGNRTCTAFVAAETGESLVTGPEAVSPLPGDAPGSAVILSWMARSQVSPDLSAATQGRRRSPSRNPPCQFRQPRQPLTDFGVMPKCCLKARDRCEALEKPVA